MNDVIMWIIIAIVIAAVPALLWMAYRHTFSHRPVEEKYRSGGGGLGGALDAVWSPSAHEAAEERGRQLRASIPAPTPDKGPGRMGDDGRIVIEVV